MDLEFEGDGKYNLILTITDSGWKKNIAFILTIESLKFLLVLSPAEFGS